MKRKTITQVILEADEGMRLTNGETYAEKKVILPEGTDESVWYEISESEYSKIQEKVVIE